MAPDYPHVTRFGPLGRFYRHVLVSPRKAAEALAEVAISPPSQQPRWTISVYRHYDGRTPVGCQVTVDGDGERARLFRPGQDGAESAQCNFTGLAAIMLNLITEQAR